MSDGHEFKNSCIKCTQRRDAVAFGVANLLFRRKNTMTSALQRISKQQHTPGYKFSEKYSPICKRCGSRVLIKQLKNGGRLHYCPKCRTSDADDLEYTFHNNRSGV